MKTLQEYFATWRDDSFSDSEDALQKLQMELFAMAGCTDASKVALTEVVSTYKEDPLNPGSLLEVDGEWVRRGTAQMGWVCLMDQDAESFDLYFNTEFKAHFGTSSRGAIACFGELADGQQFRAMVHNNKTEGRK